MTPFRIVTVCTGNICRSPMAEYVIRDAAVRAGIGDRVEVGSVGTTREEVGNPVDPRAGALLRDHGLDASAHRARTVDREELAAADLVLALDHDHVGPLERLTGERVGDGGRLRMLRSFDPSGPEDLGIRDPWYGGEEDFATVWDQVTAAADGIVAHVREQVGDAPTTGGA